MARLGRREGRALFSYVPGFITTAFATIFRVNDKIGCLPGPAIGMELLFVEKHRDV